MFSISGWCRFRRPGRFLRAALASSLILAKEISLILPDLVLLLFILKDVKHLFLKLKANSLYESLENPEVDYYLKIWITISKSGLQSRNGGRPIPRKICRLLLWQVHWNVNQFTQERSKESYGKCILYNLRKVSGNPLKISENKWTNLTNFFVTWVWCW